MVYPVGIFLLCDDFVNDGGAETAAELPHIGGVDVAVEDARNVIALVYGDELAAERIAVTVLEQNLLAGSFSPEIHCEVFAVER